MAAADDVLTDNEIETENAMNAAETMNLVAGQAASDGVGSLAHYAIADPACPPASPGRKPPAQVMNPSLFDGFADLIDFISPRSIVATLERESGMLVEDVLCHRPVPRDEVESILTFCRFVKTVRTGSSVATFGFGVLPPASHLEFYRKTVVRLVTAAELPASALTEFDHCFFKDNLLKPLTVLNSLRRLESLVAGGHRGGW